MIFKLLFGMPAGDVIGIVAFQEGCFLVYCDLESNIGKKSVACPTTTTPSVDDTTPVVKTTKPIINDTTSGIKTTTPSVDDTTTSEPIIVTDVFTTPSSSEFSTTTVGTPEASTTPEVTTPTPYCVYNNFQYMPGDQIGKVEFNGECYFVYCDSDSTIKKDKIACPTTKPVRFCCLLFLFLSSI